MDAAKLFNNTVSREDRYLETKGWAGSTGLLTETGRQYFVQYLLKQHKKSFVDSAIAGEQAEKAATIALSYERTAAPAEGKSV